MVIIGKISNKCNAKGIYCHLLSWFLRKINPIICSYVILVEMSKKIVKVYNLTDKLNIILLIFVFFLLKYNSTFIKVQHVNNLISYISKKKKSMYSLIFLQIRSSW